MVISLLVSDVTFDYLLVPRVQALKHGLDRPSEVLPVAQLTFGLNNLTQVTHELSLHLLLYILHELVMVGVAELHEF